MNWELQILTILKRILVIRSQCVKKHPWDFRYHQVRHFPCQFHPGWWRIVTKTLTCISHASVWDPLTCLLSKGVLKRGLLDICLTPSLEVYNFGSTLVVAITFFFKMFKIWCKFQKQNKNAEKVFRFLDNCPWIGRSNLSQSQTRYLSSEVNVLTNTPKISHITKWNIFHP